jgi:hypothetical protein
MTHADTQLYNKYELVETSDQPTITGSDHSWILAQAAPAIQWSIETTARNAMTGIIQRQTFVAIWCFYTVCV